MKLLSSILILLLLIGCGDSKNTSNPSIANNSNRTIKEVKANYANIPSKKLLKEIQAHYHLDQFDLAKDKLVVLQKKYPDSFEGTNLLTLKKQIDDKLAIIQKKVQAKNKLKQNERLAGSLDKMRYTQKNGLTTYYDKDSPKFSTKECFYPYIVLKNDQPKLFFRIRYISTSFLNIQDYMINVDKLDHVIHGNVEKTKLKGKKKYTVELLDKAITTKEDLSKLEAIANGKEVTAVYVGTTTFAKREINEQQKASIQNVLDAYAYLKNKYKFTK